MLDDITEDDTRVEDLVIGFTDAYNEAADSGDKILCSLLKEEMRKLLSNSGPIFKIDNNLDLSDITFEV